MLAGFLNSEELARAGRFRFQRDRDQFVVARARLREALAAELDVKPGEVEFAYGPNGKPSVPGGPEFNLAHSGQRGAIALAARNQVGVDLERIRPALAESPSAEKFFSPAEQAGLAALTPEQRLEGFFNCWTAKEAYVKATGEGVSARLTDFDVELRPGLPPSLLATRPDPAEARRWRLMRLDAGPGYVLTACVEVAVR